ncbi:MAG: polyphosphate kinase 1 [Saprospiraceae bacterium]|mgnify:FL=1|jgi:polyphosphate kinase|nr:polyphosphate kinase 1 [Candidatus Brachybacter algidus]MBP7540891.1 polyphosphate kinase 1 [Saprospiraceae bacterium]MBK8355597.1 polyphosphate kinase 1 [Candidatus Brachybacter algidus]MBK8748666.1 polyphosphate kinase 1 [Candidatus Brachybacter algidus]MBK8843502.1 polyphosphate kinase 1 [Candidatus Brachybacter algidus]MBK9552850.1 polyphosphate kinase 1 [Candidatus Brachybacter algidus]
MNKLDLSKIPYIERDISWLEFNYRVLQEARDPTNPLMERLKFIAIFSSNRDEFYRVRVAHHRNIIRLGKKEQKALDFDSNQIMKDILRIVNKQQIELNHTFLNEIIPDLKNYGINILRRLELNDVQVEFVEDYFRDNMLPFVQPVLLVEDRVRPFLNNSALYLAIHMQLLNVPNSPDQYAIVKIPSDHLPRFIEIPSASGMIDLIFIDDIVRHSISWLFPGYKIIDTYSIKLTRDAELYIDDEHSGDLAAKIKQSLNKRNVGPAARLVYDEKMPVKFRNYLKGVFELETIDMFPEGRYHNKSDFFKFPDFGIKEIMSPKLFPVRYKRLDDDDNFWEEIKNRDDILYYPYNSYDPVIKMFELAAKDPDVTHIKLIQYRVAKDSKIMEHLIAAAESGTQVTVFIEIKARFDEEANLRWGEKLSRSGIKVHYSIPGIKVHSKLALIRRIENDKPKFYSYLSTGNFHEDTAKFYTDFGLFTVDERYTKDVMKVFNYIETGMKPSNPFEHLLVGQFNLRQGFEDLIRFEIEQAQKGKPAKIFLKMNSLQDKSMIDLLYYASQQGVKIRMIIRGICSLVPGIPGVSDNIEGISIVDRYLEHARVFIFHNRGDEKIYLSSADWMERNLSHRVETAFPIFDKDIKVEIHRLMLIQWEDNMKARSLKYKHVNEYIKNDGDFPNRSQEESYYFIKRKEDLFTSQED